MTNSEIFTKAHAAARTIRAAVGNYAIAFSLSLKKIYADIKAAASNPGVLASPHYYETVTPAARPVRDLQWLRGEVRDMIENGEIEFAIDLEYFFSRTSARYGLEFSPQNKDFYRNKLASQAASKAIEIKSFEGGKRFTKRINGRDYIFVCTRTYDQGSRLPWFTWGFGQVGERTHIARRQGVRQQMNNPQGRTH